MQLQPADHWARHMRVRTPRRRLDVREQMLDAEAVLFDAASGRMHRMNATALAIWRLCDGERTTEDAARILADHYDVDACAALDDVEQTLVQFAGAGLIEGAPS